MNIMFNGLLVLSVLGVVIQGALAEDGINLNFQQNDYQFKFERVELVRYSKSIFKELSIVTFKYNRTTAVTNTTFTANRDLGYDLESVLQAYKFMSNEYRFFPMHFAANLCIAIAADVGGIKSGLSRCGNFNGCPIIKGKEYSICNFYPDPSKLPPFIPNGQYKLEMQTLHSSIEAAVVNGYATIFRPIV